jgi:hypothetical protein
MFCWSPVRSIAACVFLCLIFQDVNSTTLRRQLKAILGEPERLKLDNSKLFLGFEF